MKADAKTEAEVLATMNKWLESYRQRDMDAVMSTFSTDDDLLLYGTGIDEKRIGLQEVKSQVERDWSQMEELEFNLTWSQISAEGPIAWLAADGVGKGSAGDHHFEFPLRITGVLKRQGNAWQMVQSHISLPAGGQEEGDSVPV